MNIRHIIEKSSQRVLQHTRMMPSDTRDEALSLHTRVFFSSDKLTKVYLNLIVAWAEDIDGYVTECISNGAPPDAARFNERFFSRTLVSSALEILNCESMRGKGVTNESGNFAIDLSPAKPFVPTVTWAELESKIVGHDAAKKAIKFAVDSADKNAELLAKFGRSTPRGMLLYGPPGTGKTMLARLAWEYMTSKREPAAAPESKKQRYNMWGLPLEDDKPKTKTMGEGFFVLENIKDMWYGNTEKRIASAFKEAREWAKANKAKAVLFVDEADELLGARGGHKTVDLVPCFLAEMDNVDKSLTEFNPYVILATNRLEALDPAIIRAGRIDSRIKVDLPTEADTRALFALYFGTAPFQAGYDLQQATDDAINIVNTKVILPIKAVLLGILTPEQGASIEPYLQDLTLKGKLTGATICGLVDKAKTHALERIIAAQENEEVGGICKADVTSALNELINEMRQAPLDGYMAAELARVAQHVQQGIITAAETGGPSKNELAAMSLMRETKGGLN